jgi:hypothetical protein
VERKLNLSTPGTNPTVVSYHASDVKILNATSSLVRFENKSISYKLGKTLKSTAYVAGVVVVNSEVVWFTPGPILRLRFTTPAL